MSDQVRTNAGQVREVMKRLGSATLAEVRAELPHIDAVKVGAALDSLHKMKDIRKEPKKIEGARLDGKRKLVTLYRYMKDGGRQWSKTPRPKAACKTLRDVQPRAAIASRTKQRVKIAHSGIEPGFFTELMYAPSEKSPTGWPPKFVPSGVVAAPKIAQLQAILRLPNGMESA